ncbi:ABC transporter ATP-binding protein [Actinomarinicola tropica]|uniref:ATP-binding cassette domain-containing protein n=1 Tax=Actinomarinicola tropica TaxID=2789776 RepID=A0A5Q2RL17_9ACTN|nr:ATP-binding cassette domain-containing protein [Actinomarinicola tropica]QGG95126.1 ATP-binding cassette domain-containing protein [Actinomarinicola tropica]
MTDGGPALLLSGVGVRIDGRTILHDVDWRVDAGQRWVVLGPNGAGKTTLLRIASLRLHPTTGRVEVLGGELGRIDVRRHRQRIGITSAAIAAALRAEVRTVDVVVTAARGALEPWWHTYEEAELEQAHALLADVGIGHLADHAIGTLSSGERQRALLARALMVDPGLLILDEPAAGLDLGGREALMAQLAALAADPSSPPSILVTHHLEEIPPGVTHALLLRDGAIHAAGPAAEVLTDGPVSSCFGVDVQVSASDGRFHARAVGGL